MDSQFKRPIYKMLSQPTRNLLSNKSLHESVSLKPVSKKPSTSDSSAGEADDEHLKTQVAVS